MIAYVPIVADERLSIDINSEPDLLIAALRLHQGFLIQKAAMYPGWEDATELESQIAQRLIERIQRTVAGKHPIEISSN